MEEKDNILDLLRAEGSQAARKLRRAVILQPGAIGDCILTLPLAKFMKDSLDLGSVDIMGHTEYTGILPGRTCINGTRSIDLLDLHRLFMETSAFDVSDGDTLMSAFREYSWVATFLGEPGSDFEQNLIFTINCTHSADVITLSLKPPKEYSKHLTKFYIEECVAQAGLSAEQSGININEILIRSSESDIDEGRVVLRDEGVDFSKKIIFIHPGSGSKEKCWHLDNFLAVAEKLASQGKDVIFLLGPAELERFSKDKLKKIKQASRCLTDLSLKQVLGVLSCADSYLGNDSGITHLAGALGVKTIAVFGPTNPAVYKPIGPAVTVLEDDRASFAKKPSAKMQQRLLSILTG
ncbi:glycosyltransferase family 9 protein [Planctomycetota bacterium]